MTGAYQYLALASDVCLCSKGEIPKETWYNANAGWYKCDKSCSGNSEPSSISDSCGANI